MNYLSASRSELMREKEYCLSAYGAFASRKMNLDLSRGKPNAEQLAISAPMLSFDGYLSCDGFDCRNYGKLEGVDEMRALFSSLTDIPASRILACGNSSLNLMYDTVARAMLVGVVDSPRPWCKEETVTFLCPVPGYDRHFRICEKLGIRMLPIPMTDDGPDMAAVEEAVKDPSVKGIWCVPKYSNPTGAVYADDTVRRLAGMKTAAPDFRIFWDNAYAIHSFDGDKKLLDIFAACREAGNENRVFYFTSTSKITFPGGGVAMFAANEANLAQILPHLGTQTIGFDKLNQLRHVAFLKSKENVEEIMRRHAAVIRPKFDAVLQTLESDLAPCGFASWTKPTGGYFISLDVLPGTAKRVYELAKSAGVTLTPAGATFPYGIDPEDKNLRLAPTYATLENVAAASEGLCICVRLAALEKLLAD